jgi:hypothetical protein
VGFWLIVNLYVTDDSPAEDNVFVYRMRLLRHYMSTQGKRQEKSGHCEKLSLGKETKMKKVSSKSQGNTARVLAGMFVASVVRHKSLYN